MANAFIFRHDKPNTIFIHQTPDDMRVGAADYLDNCALRATTAV